MVKRAWGFIEQYSVLLLSGAVLALVWANIEHESYHHLLHLELWVNDWIGHLHDGHRVLTPYFIVNDLLMALFFAIAGKEVWEAVRLKDGALHNPKTAAVPLIATLGGMAGPAGVYVLGAMMVGKLAVLANGWAIPMATDIAFSYLIARVIFGAKHPAIPFLLLLAIADDAGGLIVLAVFYPQAPIVLGWLVFTAAVAIATWFVLNRTLKVKSFWPYLLFGFVGWWGFMKAGIHPALGLLPMIPTMPHHDSDPGIFSWVERGLRDTLNQFEHQMKGFVEVVLGLFGLFNAGVVFSSIGDATWLVLAGLLIGKPLGIWGFGILAAKGLKLGLPEGMTSKDLWVVGCIAAIGFTVALFIAAVAFDTGPIQDAAKMGALLSFFAAVVSLIMGRALKVEKMVD